MEELVIKIENILNEVLPKGNGIFRYVGLGKGCFGGKYIKIAFAVNSININQVQGQKPQLVSLMLHSDLELKPQCFGGNGGQSIYRKPNLELREEKFLAMKSVKIPFKQPKKEEKFVLAAIKRFAENWIKVLKENKDVLMYTEYVDYNILLNTL